MMGKYLLFSKPMVLALLAGIKTETRRISDGEPRFEKGDMVCVREAIVKWKSGAYEYARFDADQKAVFLPWPSEWKRNFAPAMHMPRKFSRLTLRVRSCRIEPLFWIDEAGAKAEGVGSVEEYAALWDKINGPGSWEKNPNVEVTSFNVIHKNIDLI